MSASELKDKLAEFLPTRTEKPLNASILFPELAKELRNNPSLAGNVKGLVVVTVLKNRVKKDEWYGVFQGRDAKPIISQTRPSFPPTNSAVAGLPVVVVELEDADILNMITGGLTGLKAFTTNRIKIVGDLDVARQIEEVFVKTGGVEKAMEYLERAKAGNKGEKRAKAKL
ncbi:hypothetical protein HK104_003848 [Borealophlyctis nickersoniae]|nr:hypothetical protein HK104_003848 [Borealophlyctis nickersoniae]